MTTYKASNLFNPINTAIDDAITADDMRFIEMLHELGSVEQKYYVAELNRAATASRRARQSIIEKARRKEMQI